MSYEVNDTVKVNALPIGNKNRKLIGRTGRITHVKNYSGIDFYTVAIDPLPRERGLNAVANITASKLEPFKNVRK